MSNQSEKEFFALVATGRKGVEEMFGAMGGEMQGIAAPNIATDFDTWKMRALVEVTTNENIRSIIQTREGIHSVYSSLSKALTMGLQIGGQFSQAYLVPKSGKVVLMPSADGYIFMTTYGPGALFRVEPQLREVYEKDKIQIREAEGLWVHEYPEDNPFGDRGKLVGYFTVLEFKDGRRGIPYVRIKEVEDIENAYGNKGSPMYTKSLIDAHRKTAMKKMLKPYAKLCEGIAMLMSLDEYAEGQAQGETDPTPRNVTERAASRLDAAAKGFDPDPPVETKPAEKVEPAKPEPKKDEKDDPNVLF
jgi:recombinational DNA repair protein RecT